MLKFSIKNNEEGRSKEEEKMKSLTEIPEKRLERIRAKMNQIKDMIKELSR
ncbi:MAG: hypothetical protein ACQEWV_31760 [Bacillota bacterium]